MPYRPIHWARQSVGGRYVEHDGSRLLNFYASRAVMPEEAKATVILQATPGYQAWVQVPVRDFAPGVTTPVPTGDQVGIFGMLSVDTPLRGKHLYGISNSYQFFDISQGGTGSETLPTDYDPIRGSSAVAMVAGSEVHNFTVEVEERARGRVRLVSDGTNVMFVSPNNVHIYKPIDPAAPTGAYTLTDQVLAPVPSGIPEVTEDPDALLGARDWVDCGWVDGYFILLTRAGEIFHSLLRSVDFDQLDFARAEANPDGVMALEILNRRLYIFGQRTIEQWYNAGQLDFAFARDSSFVAELGCAARESVARNEEVIAFVASNRTVCIIHGRQLVQISTDPVNDLLERCDVERCRAFTYTEAGHRFYSLTMFFPDEDPRNWTYDFNAALWHERDTTSVLCSVEFDDRNLIGIEADPHIFQLHRDITTAAGTRIVREAITPVITANEQRARMLSFQVDIPQRGNAQGENETVSIEISDDGQRTWSDRDARTIALGTGRLKWNRLGQFRNRHIRLTIDALQFTDVLNAYVETMVDMS